MSTTTEDATGPGLEPVQGTDPRASKGGAYVPQEGIMVGNFAKHPAYKPNNDTHEASVRANLSPGPITDAVVACHMAAWNAGGYHDLKTGLPKVMNAGERMLLMCSELGEGADGLDGGLKDDKLPHRMMLEVEIADFNIHLFDYCGADRYDLQAAVMRSEAMEPMFGGVLVGPASTPILWIVCRHVLKAMEAHRKNRAAEHIMCLARAYRAVMWFADSMGLDVETARIEKMAFNKVRPDHQKAARLADEGKSY